MSYGKKAGLLVGMLLVLSTATAQQPDPKVMFDKYDANRDGYIDLSEYTKAGDDGFGEWDLDKDGFVNAGEMGEATRPPGGDPSIVVTVGRGLVAGCDYNSDGKCALEEYRRQCREQLFPFMDVNKDGRLSMEEALRFRGGAQPAGK
jgi:Ca2+-binding EF-hand superfamily protein